MRVRDHLLLSSIAAPLLFPRLRRAVMVPWAASILIDVDHYVWFCLTHRSLNPLDAVRFFNQAQPPQHQGTRRLHGLDVLLLLGLLGLRWRLARLLFAGIAFHVAIDILHETRTVRARRLALRRDNATCRWCGARGPDIVAHVWHQPPLLPSYRGDLLVSLCPTCHELAHTANIKSAERPAWLAAKPTAATTPPPSAAIDPRLRMAAVAPVAAAADGMPALPPDGAATDAPWDERAAAPHARMPVPLAYWAQRLGHLP